MLFCVKRKTKKENIGKFRRNPSVDMRRYRISCALAHVRTRARFRESETIPFLPRACIAYVRSCVLLLVRITSTRKKEIGFLSGREIYIS